MNSYPIVVLTARWKPKYDSISFYVKDYKYCDVLIKRSENKTIFIISHDKYNFGSLNPKYLKIENEKVFFIDKITY